MAAVALVLGVVQPVAAKAAPAAAAATLVTAAQVPAAAVADVAVDGFGDATGYHLQVAHGSSWREVAVLRPAGLDPSSWIGYQCLSGNGKYAGVVVLPASSVNVEQARDRGAFAYSVTIGSGVVHPIAAGVGLKYFSPGCGIGDDAVFTTNLGSDDAQTVLTTADLATGAVRSSVTVAGQVTSAVPTAAGVVGVAGSALVSISPAGKAAILAKVAGDAYQLHPSADGGVTFLTTTPSGQTATVRHEKDGRVTDVGSGPRIRVQLFQGRAGRAVLTGVTSVSTPGVVSVVSDKGLPRGAAASSLDGSLLVGTATGGSAGAAGAEIQVAPATGATARVPGATATPTGKGGASTPRSTTSGVGSSSSVRSTTAVPAYMPPGVRGDAAPPSRSSGLKPRGDAAPAAFTFTPRSATIIAAPAVLNVSGAVKAQTAATQTPLCAVPPGDVTKQVMQPSTAQVDWAAEMAEQGLLVGSAYSRPANWQNQGWAAYAPNTDFPLIPLSHPAGTTTTTVPRVVYEAIMAQESNYDQASWHAPEGNAGDPLIASYYGSAGDITNINYAGADCGYGIGQVTDGMHIGDSSLSARGQLKVALDYQDNIAAGLQILEGKWNQLYAAGIIPNNGDPQYLENWYFAAWAYNGGVQPGAKYNLTGCTPGPTCTGPDGTWGLGWTNNPDNLDYPPSRTPYLQSSYADAAHPNNWPYQERVIGWMGSPIVRYGSKAYTAPTYHGGSSWVQIPAFGSFCTLADNNCDPVHTNTSNPGASHCMYNDFQCWWHKPATWVASCATTCATSPYTVTTGSVEPANPNLNPPTCSLDNSKVPTSAIVVDDETSPPTNLQGCGAPNWSPGGTFTMSPGTNANGDPIGQIDIHQLGVGLGGHVWFSHTEDGSNPSEINTGTWTPTLPSLQYYTVKIHVPSIGATATNVVYTINPGGGAAPWKIRVNQNFGSEQWATIGTFAMQNGGSVALSNQSAVVIGSGQHAYNFDVAWDAVAFVPQGGTPGTPIGGSPTVQDEPHGSNPAWLNCGCAKRTAGDPVDTSTGYFSDTFTDLSTPGRGMPLTFTRSYAGSVADPTGPNAALAADGPFGYGWTFNYNMSAATDGSGNVTITQEDRSKVVFTLAAGVYTTTAPRFDATLRKTGTTYTFTRRGRALFTFDTAAGHLTAETTLAGSAANPAYWTTLAYNTAGQLSTITDPGGRKYTLTWTGNHITALADTAGRQISYAYNTAGDLTDVYGVATTRSPSLLSNDRYTYTYVTGKHLMASIRTPKNYTATGGPGAGATSMTYDTADRVLTQTDPMAEKTTFSYGPTSSPPLTAGQTLVTDPAGHKTLDTYSGGLLTSQTKGYGTADAGTWSYTYDPISLGVTTESDPDGNLQTFSYDTHGNRTSASNPLGYTTLSMFDNAGDVIETVDPTGVATVNTYDLAGHINTTATATNTGAFTYGDLTSTTVTQANNVVESTTGNFGAAPARTMNYYYTDPAHPADVTKTVDPNNHTTTATYDSFGDKVSATDAMGDVSKAGYNTGTGQVASTVTGNGVAAGIAPGCTPPTNGCTSYTYNPFNQVTQTTDPLGHTTKATYDADGDTLTATDGNTKTTTISYDTADRPTLVTKADNTTNKTDYNLDSTVADTIDGLGQKTTYGHDGQGRNTSTTDPDNRTHKVTFDPAGRTTTVVDALNRAVTPTLDAAGEVTHVAYSDGVTPAVSYTYDADGRALTMADGTGSSSYRYDTYGEITASTNGAGATVGYTYDPAGNVTGITYPNQPVTVVRGFDNANRVTSIKDFAGNSTTFGYDHDSALTSTGYPNGVTVTNTLNNAEQLTAAAAAKATTTLVSLGYGRDNAGQISSQTVAGATQTFGYTNREQLGSTTGGVTGTGGTATYVMDAADHPTTVGTATQTFDPAGQQCWSTTTTVTTPTCGTVPASATTYTFDGVGERTKTTPATGTASAYTYNQAGQLATASTPAGSGSYTYNGAGLRISKTAVGNTTQYTWDAANNLLTDGTTTYLYGPGGLPLEQTSTAGTNYFIHDQIGSTRALLDSTGTVAGSYTYTPYGNATHTGTAATALQYTGQYHDTETGLTYLRARYYDPTTAQFLTIDPLLAATGTPYAYVDGSPGNYTDPGGLAPACDCSWNDVGGAGGAYAAGEFTGGGGDAGASDPAPSAGSNAPAAAAEAPVAEAPPCVDGGRTSNLQPGNNATAIRGKEIHGEPWESFRSDNGLGPGVTNDGGIPDGTSADGGPLELKPYTRSGLKTGTPQLRRYVQATGQKGYLYGYVDDNGAVSFKLVASISPGVRRVTWFF